MSDIIRLLPDSVANQIAAGEVIQRPASVVKELVENSIDAGAKHIDVVVTDAGKSSIQIIDDGKGMSETDARLSFERHATSKIKQASDLFNLHTMGFRGEALASIAAVAQVELRTRQENDELGTQILISGSNIESQEVVTCQKGTIFSVKNLFFNVPARRKFLKSNQTELTNILNEFERIALVNPGVSFTLTHNNSELYQLPINHIRQRIIGLFGKKINQDLLSLEVDTTMIKISGYIGRPESARKKGARQYFFVNGRYMRHPYFHKAIMEAYEHLIPTGEQISYFIYFDIDPANIDVNIHPTKTEIKFENEQAIWQIIAAAVKETLGKFNAVPSIDFDTEGMPDIPAFEAEQSIDVMPPTTTYNPEYNPFNTSSVNPSSYSRPSQDWSALYSGLEKSDNNYSKVDNVVYSIDDFKDSFSSGQDDDSNVEPTKVLHVSENTTQHFQFKGKFILTSVKSGLMIIDQQRAHIRILYDKYMDQIARRQQVSQGVLFPEIIQFPTSELHIVEEIKEDLSYLGFELTDLGGGSYSINGIPAGIEGLNPSQLITGMVHNAIEKECKVKDEIEATMALSLAKAAAIVPGQVLTNDEMNNLVDDLFALSTPLYTPDGKTVLSVIEENDIEKLFK